MKWALFCVLPSFLLLGPYASGGFGAYGAKSIERNTLNMGDVAAENRIDNIMPFDVVEGDEDNSFEPEWGSERGVVSPRRLQFGSYGSYSNSAPVWGGMSSSSSGSTLPFTPPNTINSNKASTAPQLSVQPIGAGRQGVDYFWCGSVMKIYRPMHKCNGVDDCGDGSDEWTCPYSG